MQPPDLIDPANIQILKNNPMSPDSAIPNPNLMNRQGNMQNLMRSPLDSPKDFPAKKDTIKTVKPEKTEFDKQYDNLEKELDSMITEKTTVITNDKLWLKEMKEQFGNVKDPYVFRFSGEPKIDLRFKSLPPEIRIVPEVDDKVDSITVNTQFYGLDVFYPYKLSIDEYVKTKKKIAQKKAWDSLLTQYDLSKALSGGDLSRMLSQSTGLTIPLPPNPIVGIFGKPEININVSGEVNLRLGWRFDTQNLGTVSAFGQTQSSPIFSQDIRVNVNGRIGDKLKIGTDWNTRNQFEYANKFKVGYEGEDDEIIKLIEVGNVSLPLQSTLIGGGQALFGVRADFQFGPLFLKTLISQKRGERKSIDVQGGASKSPFSLRAYDFAKNHFFLDSLYKPIYDSSFAYSTPIIPTGGEATRMRIKQIEVWESQNDVASGALSADVIAVDLLPPKKLMKGENYAAFKNLSIKAGEVEKGKFQKLDTTRYRVDYNLGTISINNLRQDRSYAVSFITNGTTNPVNNDSLENDYYGTPAWALKNKDTMVLRLIYRPNMQPGFKVLWSRMMKNIYNINATNVNMNDTRIGIYYLNQTNDSADVLPGAPDKIVSILGVDQSNNATGTANPDGLFDMKFPFFNALTGEITFPSSEPFRGGLLKYFRDKLKQPNLADQYTYPDVYDTTLDAARRNTARDRFIISGEVSGRATNRIFLGAYNLAPNSVRVTLDGVQLREFEDYVVEYFSGTLTLRNARAQMPNANLKIEYEQNDVFNVTTRTLLGLRGDLELYKGRRFESYLGFTAMYYDQSAIVDRVRLGEEPVSNTMLGLDARMSWDMPWFTRMLNYLPLYETKAPSSLVAKGEVAMILPEPNKRLSEITSDNSAPVVYVDDFEGAQRYISLGLSPTLWYHASPPVDNEIDTSDIGRALFRSKSWWFQYFIPRVPINEVYPKKSVLQGRSNISPLIIEFDPARRGIYNRNTNMRDSANPEFKADSAGNYYNQNKTKFWGGMMRLFSSYNTNFDAENIEYIEVMMRVSTPDYQNNPTQIFLDLGQISEDVIPNGALNTEDGITSGNPVANGMIDAGEDVGLDTKNEAAEKSDSTYWPLNLETDPSKDNYGFDFTKDDMLRTNRDFENFNNHENNSIAELGQFPDTEILNKNNGQTVSLDNSYFSYEIKLDPNPLNNPQIVGGGTNGWFLYRIPIRKPTKKVGNPLFTNIQYVRLWFKGGKMTAEIADWRLVGSHWQRNSSLQAGNGADTTLEVAFVNVEENSGPPDYYSMPPGVEAPRQLGNTDAYQDIRLNEQSLSVSVKNLRYNDERMAVRFFRPLDIFFYKQLKFFIHGDGSMPDYIANGSSPKGYAYLRFGIDSNNYYEYRRPITRGWQSIEVQLSQLTAIKQIRDSLGQFNRQVFPIPNDPLGLFAIKGNPILTRVEFFGIGIANPAERFPNELTTTMWVDELRLINPEDANDWGAVGNVELKMADLGVINASVQHTKPNFHKLEDRFGNRISSTNWSVSVQGNLEKFANKLFKEMKAPISYTHSEFVQDPEYVANSDIKLNEAAENTRQKAIKEGKTVTQANQLYDATIARSQTVRVQDSWGMQGVKLGIPINHWLVKETFNKLVFGYSYAQEFERSPVVAERFNWLWQMQTQYSLAIPEVAAFKPLTWLKSVPLLNTYSDLKINPLPSNINTTLNMQRRRTTEQSRFLTMPSPVVRDFSVNKVAQLTWKFSENGLINPSLEYSLNTTSTLVPFELDETGKQLSGAEIFNRIFMNNGKLFEFGDNTMHNQNVTLNAKPRLPLGEYTKMLEFTGTYGTNYIWNDPLQKDPRIRDVVKTAAWNNTQRYTAGFRMKEFFEKVFDIQGGGGSKPAFMQNPNDTTQKKNLGGESSGTSVFSSIGSVLKSIFIDFEKFDFTLSQTNTSVNPGVFGSTGITNFWGRGLTGRESLPEFGPSFAYQLGFVTDPFGSLNTSSRFPFFQSNTTPGLRPANAVLQENYSQKSQFEVRTTRMLWPGAVLDLNWKAELAFNKNQTLNTGANGIPQVSNLLGLESFGRNFLNFQSFLGILDLSSIQDVVDQYKIDTTALINDPAFLALPYIQQNKVKMKKLADGFRNKLETFSIFNGDIGKYLPAVNWTFRWEGLEKLPLLKSFAKKISIEHNYTSKYQENSQINGSDKVIQGQQIQSGFQPLIGVNVSLDEAKFNGIVTASAKYITNNSYMLSSSNRATISMQTSDELQLNGSYTQKGFEFPLFGLILKNDLEWSFLGSYKKSRQSTFDIEKISDEKGRTLNGSTQITIEPRIRYSMSNRVSASFFIRYEGTFTEGASQPGYNTTQFGLDLRISIAGGR